MNRAKVLVGIAVLAAGVVVLARLFRPPPVGDDRPSSLEPASLPAAFFVEGSIVDATGKPVGGAEVGLVRSSEARVVHKATAEASGRFVVAAPDRSPGWRLEARAPGLAPSYLDDLPAGLASTHVGRVFALPSATLRGRVVDRAGNPVVGAEVFVSRADGDRAPARTKPDGSFEIGSLSPGVVAVGASAPGHADAIRRNMRLDPGEANAVELVVGPDIPLEGLAVDEKGAAVAEARVEVAGADRAFWRKPVETDALGRFRIAGLGPSRRGLEVRLSKYGFGIVRQDGTNLPPDGRFVVKRGPLVALRVDRSGAPPPAIRSVRYEVYTRVGEGWARRDGTVEPHEREVVEPRFWRFALPSGGTAKFQVTAEDGSSAEAAGVEVRSASGPPLEVRVPLERGSVAGQVVGPEKEAVAGLTIELAGEGEGRGVFGKARTDADGSFRFEEVPPGHAQLFARSTVWVVEATPISIGSGERREGVELVARKASSVVGRLTIGGEAPGEEVPIAVYRAGGRDPAPTPTPIAVVATDAAGEFRIESVPAGRVSLAPKRPATADDGAIRSFLAEWPHASAGGQRWTVSAPPEGEVRLEMDLPPIRPTRVHGVVRVNGEPREGARISLAGGEPSVAFDDSTDEEGRFRFRLDRGGTYEVRLSADAFPKSEKVVVEDGEDRQVLFEVAAGSVEGKVVDASGEPIALRVQLERPADPDPEPKRDPHQREPDPWASVHTVLSGDDGAYALPEVAVGTYRVFVYDVESRFALGASEPFDVVAGERTRVPSVTLQAEAPLRVTFKHPDPHAPWASVRVKPASGTPALPRPVLVWGGDGEALVRGLAPGTYVVSLQLYGPWQALEQTVTLAADGSETAAHFEIAAKE